MAEPAGPRFDPWLIPRGFLMGAADIVPGVSGGTIAFITGIYERLLAAIRSFDAVMVGDLLRLRLLRGLARPHWGFILPLVGGIAAALYTFTNIFPLPLWMELYPERVYGFFFGLIAASAVVLVHGLGGLRLRDLAALLAGLALGLLIVTAVPTTTPTTWWFTMIAGALAITAMLVPGISGSFILLLLGQYTHVFGAIGRFDLSVLVPLGIGMVAGLIAFARVIGWLMARHNRLMVLLITGVLIGSLWLVWPFRRDAMPALPSSWGGETFLVLGLILAGILLVGLVHVLARRRR